MKLPTIKYWRIDYWDVTGIQETSEGFWKITGTAAKVGPLPYMDQDGNEHVEYADAAVLKNYARGLVGKPVTDGHPPEGKVTPGNFKHLVVGTVLEAWFDSETEELKVVLMVNDADAQASIGRGRVQLSPGYFATLGEAPEGVDATYLQVTRDYNHLALVDEARGGDSVRLHLDEAGHMTVLRNDAADPKADKEEKADGEPKEDGNEKYDALKEKHDALQAKYDAMKSKLDAMEKDGEHEDGEDKPKNDGFSEADFSRLFADHSRALNVATRLGIRVDDAETTLAIKTKVIKEKMGELRNDSKVYIDAAFDAVAELYPAKDSVEKLATSFRGDGSHLVDSDKYGSLDFDKLVSPNDRYRKGVNNDG